MNDIRVSCIFPGGVGSELQIAVQLLVVVLIRRWRRTSAASRSACANVDVLNTQQQVSTTERDPARSRYDTLMSLLRLQGRVGKLSDTDVTGLSALLN